MNAVFFAIVLISFGVAAYREVFVLRGAPDAGRPMEALATGMIDTAADSVHWRLAW